MTSYTTINANQIDAESPIDVTLAGAWTNNVIAVTEGDASAPKIASIAMENPFYSLVTSAALSGSSVNLTGAFSDAFKAYRIVIMGGQFTAGVASVNIRLGNGGTYHTGAFDYATTGATASSITLCGAVGASSTVASISAILDFYSPGDTTTFKPLTGKSSVTDVGSIVYADVAGHYRTGGGAAITDIQIFPNTSTWNAGNVYVYGVHE